MDDFIFCNHLIKWNSVHLIDHFFHSTNTYSSIVKQPLIKYVTQLESLSSLQMPLYLSYMQY